MLVRMACGISISISNSASASAAANSGVAVDKVRPVSSTSYCTAIPFSTASQGGAAVLVVCKGFASMLVPLCGHLLRYHITYGCGQSLGIWIRGAVE